MNEVQIKARLAKVFPTNNNLDDGTCPKLPTCGLDCGGKNFGDCPIYNLPNSTEKKLPRYEVRN